MKTSFLFLALFALARGQVNTFRLANYYADEMVLQMEPKSAVIWGYGEPSAEITISYESIKIFAAVDDAGKWSVTLQPHAASELIDISIKETSQSGMSNSIILRAMFGDVWICSGQSNMEMPIKQIFNATEEETKALNYQNIRLIKVDREFSLDGELEEVTSFKHSWSAPTAENVPEFSAICIMFAERLSDSLGGSRPFGLVQTSWPGTRIEAWSSSRVTNYCNTPANNDSKQNSNSALWNAMVSPLTKTSVRGAIWFQGESNIDYNQEYYGCHLLGLINDWKSSFFQGDVADENGIAFPFGVIQNGPNWIGHNYNWGDVRWQQTLNQGVLPNPFLPEAFTAATYDLTDHLSPTSSNHPRDKQTNADRLANAAKKLLSYDSNVSSYGPVPTVILQEPAGTWTVTYDRNIKIIGVPGFAYQLPNGTFELTEIISSTSNSVSVTADLTATHLVYAFSSYVCEYKECAVYSDDQENLPAQVWLWNLA